MSRRSGVAGQEVEPTIYDVAAHAGVSISTVSLALNSPGRVADATRQRVLAAADALGFVPRSEAVSRARRTVGRVGVVAPFTSYPSFAHRLNGILRALRGHAIDVVIFDEESAATNANPLLSSLPLTHRLDGLIVMALPLEDETAQRLRRAALPTVLVDTQDDRFDSVVTDDAAGGRLAARHLIDQGGSSFAFLGEQQRSHAYVSQAERRLEGFAQGLRDGGIAENRIVVRLTGHGRETTEREATELLAATDRPDAVFAHDDVLAGSVLRAARALGLRVPEDVAVIGYDDGEVAHALDLTTIRQPLEESGAVAAGMLRDRLAEKPSRSRASRCVTLGLEVVQRGTTR